MENNNNKTEPKKFSSEVKRTFLEIVSTYNKYQEQMDRKSDITQVAETLGGIIDAAEQLIVNEADGWFDKHTVKRNLGELKKLGVQFDKVVIEAKGLDQRMSGLYEDMGHILSRYYKLGDINEDEMKQRLGMNEAKLTESKPVKGRKSFYTMNNVGSSKYTISDYDGKATHKDGSPFYGIDTFKNKKAYEKKKADLKKQGYIEESTSIKEELKNILKESVNSELDVMAGEAKNFKAFTKDVYKEFPTLPKNAASVKWLEGVYNNRTNESINEGGDRYNVVDNKGKVIKIDLAKPYAQDIANKHNGWKIQPAKSPKNEAKTPKEFKSQNGIQVHKVDIVNGNAQWVGFVKLDDQVKIIPAVQGSTKASVTSRANKLYTQFKAIAKKENINESFSPKDIEMIKKVVTKEKKLLGLSKIFKKMGWYTDFIMMDGAPPHIKLKKKKNDKATFTLVNKQYVEDPDFVIGQIAGGLSK